MGYAGEASPRSGSRLDIFCACQLSSADGRQHGVWSFAVSGATESCRADLPLGFFHEELTVITEGSEVQLVHPCLWGRLPGRFREVQLQGPQVA